MFNWISKTWGKFEHWVSLKLPGWKTHITLALGFIGTSAAAFQEYFTGMPLADVLKTVGLSPEHVTIANLVLYTLAFWFKDMTRRVDVRST